MKKIIEKKDKYNIDFENEKDIKENIEIKINNKKIKIFIFL